MNDMMLSIVIGGVLGVLAGIPTSVLLLVAMTRMERKDMQRREEEQETLPAEQQPIIVIQRSARGAYLPGANAHQVEGARVRYLKGGN